MDNRRLKREAKEKEDTAKFEAAKRDAVKRKRREAYAEAAGLMTTRAVKTLTKMRAKNVVEEMRAGLTPISFFIKKPGPPPEVRSSVWRVHSLVDVHTGRLRARERPRSRYARQAGYARVPRRVAARHAGVEARLAALLEALDALRRRQRRVGACVEIKFRGASRIC